MHYRLFDLLLAAPALVLLTPLFLLIALAVRWDSPGPVFHRGVRVGKDGVHFRLYKFRSMRVDAGGNGPAITAAGDPRITRSGAFLRRTKLDELPQLLNVLRGEMSLVGPRPEDPRYVALYTAEQRRVLRVRPGITGAASVAYRREENLLTGPDWEQVYCNQVLPAKLAIDLAWLDRRTLAGDLLLLLRTVAAVLR
jgi:lipopolysaccharide/colanic/teichoic acid biosynthesis glycosyltransferase